MAKLYEISDEIVKAIEDYDLTKDTEEAGGIVPTEPTRLEQLQIQFNEKALGVAFYIQNLESDIESINNEVERLMTRASRYTRSISRLRQYLQYNMELAGIQKIDSPTLTLAIQNNPPKVVVEDETKVPQSYKREIPAHFEIDKNAIKEAHKNNIGVEGTHIEQTKRLVIR